MQCGQLVAHVRAHPGSPLLTNSLPLYTTTICIYLFTPIHMVAVRLYIYNGEQMDALQSDTTST